MIKRTESAPRRRLLPLVCLALALPATLGAQDPLGTPLHERPEDARLRERTEDVRLRADEWRLHADDMRLRAGEMRLRAAEMRERSEGMRERTAELRTRLAALVPTRARLGVLLGETRQVGGRTGVAVDDVVEGAPAARAGIRAGDILVALDGEPLGDDPGRRLTRLMADVEPGDTVSILLVRDGREETLRVVTDRASPVEFRFGERGIPGLVRPGFDPGSVVAEAFARRAALGPIGLDRLVLVEVNPDLGRYFGVTEGVLVANIADQSSLGLQPGDILVSIGGRAVTDPAHARSILASYRAEEAVEMEVVRDHQPLVVRGVVRERTRR